jgi:hypothetical protein
MVGFGVREAPSLCAVTLALAALVSPCGAQPPTGHVDVAFAITKYGRARNVEILDATNATEADQADLVGLLKSSRFRPRLTDGEFADASPVVVRYELPIVGEDD